MHPCRRIVLLIGVALAAASGSLSNAHEQKSALTDIFYNERTGNLEIAHRFIIHDAEHVLHKVTESNADIAQSSVAQAAFAQYVADRFELTLSDKKKLKLTLVGQELERGYLWVYQETTIPKPVGASFSIKNTILQDVVKGQVNTVNVRYRSHVTTFEFEVNTGRKRFPGPTGIEENKGDAAER